MATYKVIQDIEAEDKFVGPFTLKQFIFMAITAACLWVSFFFLTKGIWFIAIILLPLEIVLGFLGFPWGRDQPTETWLLAKLRFYFKPRQRVWNQDGVSQLVNITAPQKVEEHLTKELDQTEVRSRLKALAETIDSRGWAVKNVNVNLNDASFGNASSAANSDERLLDPQSILPQVQNIASDITAADDIFDNAKASQLDQKLQANDQTRLDRIKEQITPAGQAEAEKPNFWFMDAPPEPSELDNASVPDGYATFGSQTTHGGTIAARAGEESAAEQSILAQARQRADSFKAFTRRRNINPAGQAAEWSAAATKPVNNSPSTPPTNPLTNQSDADIIRLASDNNRNVASLAREAETLRQTDMAGQNNGQLADGEVVVSLH